MHVVQRLKAQFLELAERPLPLLLLAREVEDVEPVRRRHAVVELAVSADDAVGEGEEEGEGGEDGDQRGREPLVGGKARPMVGVGEGRGQRLVRQHRARRKELCQVRRA